MCPPNSEPTRATTAPSFGAISDEGGDQRISASVFDARSAATASNENVSDDVSGYGVTDDIDGTARPRGLGYDIGAYESY